MANRLYKILEIIGILVIIYIFYKLFPFIRLILQFILKVVLPFVIAFVIAFVLEPIVEFLDKKKIKRKFAILIIGAIFVGVIFLILRFAIPLFVKELGNFMEMLPSYFIKFKAFINQIMTKFQKIPIDWQASYDKIETMVMTKLSEIIINISNNIQRSFSYVLQLLITPILAIYFLSYYPKIEDFVKKKLIKKEAIYNTLSAIKISLRNYIKGVLIIMVILSVATSFSFLIIGIDYAFLFGIIIGITDIIPYIGPYIGGAIATIFTLVSSPDKVLMVLIIIIVLQFLEGNFLVPKVQSKTMQTNPILVLLSVTFFGELLGIIGMIIAVQMEKIIEIIYHSIKKQQIN